MAEKYYSLTNIVNLCDNLIAAMPTSFYNGIMAVRGGLVTTPAADVAPVRHGRFLGTEYDGYADGNPVYYEWQCSECGCLFEDDEPTYNYCPNCGALMDKDGDGE